MKKRFVILSSLGLGSLGAGLLYALKSNRGARSGASGSEGEQSATGNGRNDDRVRATLVDGKDKSDGDAHQAAGASMGRIEDGTPVVFGDELEPQIDDRGTDQSEAAQILKNIRDTAFDESDEKLALALGRPAEEIEEWTSGSGIIDGDVVMKARGLAIQRGVEID